MLETNSSKLKAIQVKLQNLVVCVLAKAAEEPAFADALEEVLLSDSLKKKISSPVGKAKKSIFSAVAVLHSKGDSGLRSELEMFTDDDLRRIARAEGLFKGRELKSINRTELLEEIISSAQRRLTQGESFLKNP